MSLVSSQHQTSLVDRSRSEEVQCTRTIILFCIKFRSYCPLLLVPSYITQSVTRLTADTCLTEDPGVVSLIPARSHTFITHKD